MACDATATVIVSPANRAKPVPCDLLETAGRGRLVLAEGDSVLVWLAGKSGSRGVILGRVGPSRAEDSEAPEELVMEAKKNLTLRCGEGSITLREDGKILIKGKDLVSRAQRTIRIKGGSVAIN